MFTIGIFVGLFVTSLAVSVSLVYVGSRLLRLSNATWLRACADVVISTLLGLGFVWLQFQIRRTESLPLDVIEVVVSIALTLYVYVRAYGPTGKQILGLVLLHVVIVAIHFGMAWTFRSTLCEAFVIPTNGMAPTIRGHRLEGTCPDCHNTIVLTLPEEDDSLRRQILEGICVGCNRTFRPEEFDGTEMTGDRIVVNKLQSFERWDLVVFRNPEDPQFTYVDRLIGLPHEEIVIHDDGIYADGVKLEPPPDIANMRYTTRPVPFAGQRPDDVEARPLLGDSKRPMKLGPDEFFMLGDNTHRSSDG